MDAVEAGRLRLLHLRIGPPEHQPEREKRAVAKIETSINAFGASRLLRYFFFARLIIDQPLHELFRSSVLFHQTESDIIEIDAGNLFLQFFLHRLRRLRTRMVGIDEIFAVNFRLFVELHTSGQHIALTFIKRLDRILLRNAPCLGHSLAACTELGVPERLCRVAVFVHDLPHPRPAPDERPRKRHAVGVKREHVEILPAAVFVKPARKFVAVDHAARHNDRFRIRGPWYQWARKAVRPACS